MTNYEDLKHLFQLFKAKNVLKKHWSNTSGWEMVEVMHIVLLEAIKATFVVAPFTTISVDEITMINNTQWLSLHLYVVQNGGAFPSSYVLRQ